MTGKNIIIAGPSRSGKSTLARMINEELGCYVISTDKLVAVFQDAYPQLDIRLNWDRDKTTANIAPFLGHYLGTFSSSDGRAKLKYSHGRAPNNRFVLEGAYFDFAGIISVLKQYSMEDLKEHFILIGLTQKSKSADDHFRDMRRYDKEDDWTYDLSDTELRAVAEDMVSFDKEMYEQMSSYGFDIYDTSEDRGEVFRKLIEKISLM